MILQFNIKENTEEFNLNRLKFKEFKISLDNLGAKYLDQDLSFENNKNKTLITKTSIVDVYRGITQLNQISQNQIILVIVIRLIQLHKIIIFNQY